MPLLFVFANITLCVMREYIKKKRRGRGTDRGNYENSEKGVAFGCYKWARN